MSTEPRVDLVKLAVQTAVVMLAIGLALFVPAGTLAWRQGWIFFAMMLGFTIAENLWLFRNNPELLKERMNGIGRKDQEKWDKVLLAILGAAFFAWFALIGFDAVRFRWSRVPVVVEIFGGILVLVSFRLLHATFQENAFLSPAVRVQTERAQTVVRTGPYARVRHPMYAGFALQVVGAALLLGSWWGTVGAFALIALVARRAVLEERVLRQRLADYDEYLRTVRYRFVPFVW